MKERIKTTIARFWTGFPASAVLCMLLVLVSLWQSLLLEVPEGLLEALLTGLGFSVLGSLLQRRFSLPRWLGWALAACSVALSFLIKDGTVRFGLWAATVALCLHLASGREKPALCLGQVVSCFCSSLGLATCCYLALLLCSYAIMVLFTSTYRNLSSFLMQMPLLFSYWLLAPCLILGRLPDEETPQEAFAGLRKVAANLFLPAYLGLVGILLCYLVMIVLRWEMPVGQMNGLALVALSLFAAFRLSLTGEENSIARWFFRWGGWLMLPVIAGQQVGVWIRYAAYGLTASRYAGMIITLMLVLVVLWALRGKRAHWFFVAAAAAVLVLTVTPLRADQVARWNQEARLKKALIQCEMLENQTIRPNPDAPMEQQAIILSAAHYLSGLSNPPEGSLTHALQQQRHPDDAWIPDEDLFGFAAAESSRRQMYIVYGADTANSLQVEGYRHAQWYLYEYDLTGQEEAEQEALLPAETLLACADFEADTLLTEELLLPDGRTLRLCSLHLNTRDGEKIDLQVRGWLLTP